MNKSKFERLYKLFLDEQKKKQKVNIEYKEDKIMND